jgi:uncharacterized protein (DUF302 family)
MSYNLTKKINGSFNDVVNNVTEALQQEGFGIITEIDLKDKFKEKLQVDFRNYKILGACNPKLAYEAIQEEENIGVMLPCNVLVQEHNDGQVVVTAINPMETMAVVNNAKLTSLAEDVSQKLKSVLENI